MEHIVVVGAGQAGASLTAKLRSEGFAGRITLIGAEAVPPYQRPPLSKAYLLGEMPKERLYLRPSQFYEDKEITLRLSTRVDSIDRTAKAVWIGSEKVSYDKLALTTGSVPRTLRDDLRNLHVIRTLADIDALSPHVVSGRQALIVGGGYIGLEAAAVLAKKGMTVILIEAGQRILQRVACAETADFIRHLHITNGVQILEDTALDGLEARGGAVSQATLTNGMMLTPDLVVVGIGVDPATDLAKAAGLKIDNGIAVDAQGRTSAEDIWAAGDCASFPHAGGRVRLESVPHAIDHAELVARNMVGVGEDYVAKPWFWSDQFDLKLQIAGLNTGYDRVVVRETGDARSHWYFAGERLLAVDALNDPRGYMIGKRLIEGGKSPTAEQVTGPEADLKALMRG